MNTKRDDVSRHFQRNCLLGLCALIAMVLLISWVQDGVKADVAREQATYFDQQEQFRQIFGHYPSGMTLVDVQRTLSVLQDASKSSPADPAIKVRLARARQLVVMFQSEFPRDNATRELGKYAAGLALQHRVPRE